MKNRQPASDRGEVRLTGFGLVMAMLIVLAFAARFVTTGAGAGTGAALGSTSQTIGQ